MAAAHIDFTEDLETLLTCAICNEIFTQPKTLQCLHTFCFTCIKNWIETCQRDGNELNCPVCRVTITVQGGDISSIPSSFTHHSLRQIFNSKITQTTQDNGTNLQKLEDAKKLITEDKDRLTVLLENYEFELELSDENMKRIDDEVALAKKEVCDHTQKLITIIQEHESAMVSRLNAFHIQHKAENDDEKSEIKDEMEILRILRTDCQEIEDVGVERLILNECKQLHDNCNTTKRKTSILATKPVTRNSSLRYIPDSECILESMPDPSQCNIECISSVSAICGFINQFKIVTRNTEGIPCYTNGGSIDVKIQQISETLNGNHVQFELTAESETGIYIVKWTPEIPSWYNIAVAIGGNPIKNSPQRFEAIDARAELKPVHIFDITHESSRPRAIDVTDRGEIAVVFTGVLNNCHVSLFSADGEYLTNVTTSLFNRLRWLRGLAVINDNRIIISDNQGDCGYIKEFHKDGDEDTCQRILLEQQRMEFTGICSTKQTIACLKYNSMTDETFITVFAKQTGNLLQEVKLDIPNDFNWKALDLAYDNNMFFVSFLNKNKIYVFDDNGSLLYNLGGWLHGVHGLAVFGADMLLVCDTYNHRVQLFHQSGPFIRSFGSFGSDLGEMYQPVDVAVTPDGDVFVLESAGARVQLWR